jgi:alpha-L-rhamnosidase
MKSNFLDVPTDCPSRERIDWTGDDQIFFNTGAFIMDIAAFYRKWLYDFLDGQYKDGRVSASVPYVGIEMMYKNTGQSVGWNDAVVLIPYRFWKRYGDVQILTSFYDMMRKYAMYMVTHTGHKTKAGAKKNPFNKYTYEKGFHLGEWLFIHAVYLACPHKRRQDRHCL